MNKTMAKDKLTLYQAGKMAKAQEESKDLVKKFRVTKIQNQYIQESMEKLGVKDFSTFVRGALFNGIEMGFRANDPQWQNFIDRKSVV